MARKRMLKPEFFTSPSMNRLTVPAMLTFAGLWVYADDYGRGEDDLALVRATVWPRRKAMTETKIEVCLEEMTVVGVLCRHLVNGHPVLHIPSWHEHQQISHKGVQKYPPCEAHEPVLYQHFLGDDGGPLDRYRKTMPGQCPDTFQRNVVKSSLDKVRLGADGPPSCGHNPLEPNRCATCRGRSQASA